MIEELCSLYTYINSGHWKEHATSNICGETCEKHRTPKENEFQKFYIPLCSFPLICPAVMAKIPNDESRR